MLVEDPYHGQVLILNARLARLAGELGDAEILLARASDVLGTHPQLASERGYLALARSNSAAAIKYFENLISMAPQFADAHFNLGYAYRKSGRLDAAISAFGAALELGISAPFQVQCEIGSVLCADGRENEAREHFEFALAQVPGYPRALCGLGVVSAASGDFEAAEDYYRAALRGDPGYVEVYQRLADAKRYSESDDPDIIAMQQLLADSAPEYSREKLNFALGKAHDDCAKYAQAFRHFASANELKSARVTPYDRARRERRAAEIIDVFDAKRIAASDLRGSASRRPIVIVGLPRSGVTLVEQVLAAHSKIEAGGEMAFFDNTCKTKLAPYPIAVEHMTQSQVDEIADAYLQVLDGINDGGLVTDRHHANIVNLGLIAMLFPAAILVHCTRRPLDNCLSLFFQDFSAGHAYANRFDDVAHYCQQYQRLMGHWSEVLGDRLFEVPYEDMVSEPEAQIQILLEHVGLEYEQACLEAEVRDTNRPAPDYWRKYADHIGELKTCLGMQDANV